MRREGKTRREKRGLGGGPRGTLLVAIFGRRDVNYSQALARIGGDLPRCPSRSPVPPPFTPPQTPEHNWRRPIAEGLGGGGWGGGSECLVNAHPEPGTWSGQAGGARQARTLPMQLVTNLFRAPRLSWILIRCDRRMLLAGGSMRVGSGGGRCRACNFGNPWKATGCRHSLHGRGTSTHAAGGDGRDRLLPCSAPAWEVGRWGRA